MSKFQIPHLPIDLLDHLVLDIYELEDLAERLVRSLQSADLEAIPRGPMAVQLMDALSRMKDAGDALHRMSGHQIKKVAVALSSDPSGDRKWTGPNRDRMLVDAVDG